MINEAIRNEANEPATGSVNFIGLCCLSKQTKTSFVRTCVSYFYIKFTFIPSFNNKNKPNKYVPPSP